MKHCPKCAQEYFANSMNFCLADGTPLESSIGSEETLVIGVADLLDGARQKFAPELFYIYSLFGFETDARQAESIWRSPKPSRSSLDLDFDTRTRFAMWLESKRPFSVEELLSGSWNLFRNGPDGSEPYCDTFQLRQDGAMDGPADRWQLVGGALQMHVDTAARFPNPRPSDWRYFIIASKAFPHSGLELMDGDVLHHVQLELA